MFVKHTAERRVLARSRKKAMQAPLGITAVCRGTIGLGRGLGRLHQHVLERADRPRGPGERSRWPGHPQWWRDRGRAASTSGGRGFSALECCGRQRARAIPRSGDACFTVRAPLLARGRVDVERERGARGEAPLRHGPCRHRRVLPARLPPLQGGTQAGLRRAPSGDALRRTAAVQDAHTSCPAICKERSTA